MLRSTAASPRYSCQGFAGNSVDSSGYHHDLLSYDLFDNSGWRHSFLGGDILSKHNTVRHGSVIVFGCVSLICCLNEWSRLTDAFT